MSSSTPKSPALTGDFYCINNVNNPINKTSLPDTIERSKY
ncbi:hypothetical protein SynBIOSE41_03827 [Synechococcus sp. BIOS-E4-1]|nr:hypothetical protein SynBIOSE41_03827 [Synechococcus sp. BIOS-E4-1]